MPSASVISGSRLADDNQTRIHWQHRQAAEPEFDQRLFSNSWLLDHNYVANAPSAGRGASLFLDINGADLVLRHYRRGGLARKVSEARYLWFGLSRTRAWREFAVLQAMEKKALPSPKPYACQVAHLGRSYTASLITYYLQGRTLAEYVCNAELSTELSTDAWQRVGRCIRDFHAHGVFHADLNAHNILLHEGQVYLIDFDRAVIDPAISPDRLRKNVSRLQRSLEKIGGSGPTSYNESCWVALEQGYMQA